MAGESLEISATFEVDPEDLWLAWLEGEGHAELTGAPATGTPEVGAEFTAWDGYITGRNLELEPGKRIVQSWRTTEFAPTDPDSRLELLFEDVEGDTRLTIRHTELPAGGAEKYSDGWMQFYLDPIAVWTDPDPE